MNDNKNLLSSIDIIKYDEELEELINDKIQEIKDHFNTFVYEMDLLMHELDSLQKNKGDIDG